MTLEVALALVSLAGTAVSVAVFFWKGGEWKKEQELTNAAQNERISELEGTVKELDALKTLPEKLTHVSGQLDKIAGFMQGLDKDLRLLDTTSKLQAQALSIIKDKTDDHEKRLRIAEANT